MTNTPIDPKDVVLQIDGLRKHFGSVHAVEDVSLKVARGEVYGFLGPNGAGKTTTIGLVLGLLHPTAGTVTVLGQKVTPSSSAALHKVGALMSSPSLVPYLSAYQNLEILSRLHPGLAKSRIAAVLEQVGLSDAAGRKTGHFSTGMKQRLGLAMALLHQPELLILDEPTNGMDPAGMREIRLLLGQLASQGITVFLSSHLLHEVEQVCTRVAVLNKGKIVAQGSVNDLLGGQSLVKVRVPSPAEAAALLLALPGVGAVIPNGSYVTVGGVSPQEVVAHLTKNGIIPSEITNATPDLESLFLDLTAEPAEAQTAQA